MKEPDNEHFLCDDLEQIALCRQGDKDAFEPLVRKYQKKMLNIAYRIIGDYDDACEAVQDALLSAYRNIGSFRGSALFSTWLYSITVNTARNRLKQVISKNRREETSLDTPILTDEGSMKIEPVSPDDSVLKRLEKEELRQAVQKCIDALELHSREIIVLRDIMGFSYEEIGEMLKIASGTVKSRIFRARDSLRNCLKNLVGEQA